MGGGNKYLMEEKYNKNKPLRMKKIKHTSTM